jgi:flagellar biosynthesis/type III secretory pathway protein FliH
MVSPQDKRRVRYVMLNEFHSLLDEGYFVQQRKAESYAEGRQEGLAEGEAKGEAKGREEGLEEGLLEALFAVTEVRFPKLLKLAQERTRQARESSDLRLVLKGLKTAPSEETARTILDLLAA